MVARYGKRNYKRAADEAGIDRGNFYRWRDGGEVDPTTALKVAAAFGANRFEALVAAGVFTEREFDEYRSAGAERGVTDEALAREVLARLRRRTEPDRPSDPDPGLAEHEQAPRHSAGPEVPTGRRRPPRRDTTASTDGPENFTASD